MISELLEEVAKYITVKVVMTVITGSIATYVVVAKKPFLNNEVASVEEVQNEHNLESQETTRPSRKPASIAFKEKSKSNVKEYTPVTKVSAYDKAQYIEPTTQGASESNPDNSYAGNSGFAGGGRGGGSSYSSSLPSSIPQQTSGADYGNQGSSSSSSPSSRSPALASSSDNVLTNVPFKETVTKTPNKDSTNTKTNQESNSSIPTVTDNTCSSNILGGTFGNPIGITLSCLYPSKIKYCLSNNGVCCDPTTSGTTYKSKIVIGPGNGNYCLSFSGDSTAAGSSVVSEQNYTINTTLPNLTVGQSKTYFQTTELVGTSYVSSSDFGKPNISIGQINLKTHDPGPADLNYDCEEIVSNYVSLTTPAPSIVQSLFDVSAIGLMSQVEIPLRADQLDYGDNFITTYIENNAYVAPLYSCSTTKVTLDDFEYFQADVSQSVAGTNSAREFEGEFTAFGFFEDSSTVFRGPAGVSSEEKTGHNLKSGLYGVLY